MLLSESQHREKHHIIHLNGVSGKLMQQILVYMYRGEISIAQVGNIFFVVRLLY